MLSLSSQRIFIPTRCTGWYIMLVFILVHNVGTFFFRRFAMKGIIFCLSLVMTAWAARENFRDSRVTDFTPTKHQSLESSPSKAKRKSKKGVYIPNIKLTNEGNKTNVNFQPGEGVQFVLQPELVSHLRHTGSGMKHDITVSFQIFFSIQYIPQEQYIYIYICNLYRNKIFHIRL